MQWHFSKANFCLLLCSPMYLLYQVQDGPSLQSLLVHCFCALHCWSPLLLGTTISEPGKHEEPGQHREVGSGDHGDTAARRPLSVHYGEDGVGVVGGQLYIADHSFTARPTLRVFRVSAVSAADKMTFISRGTLFSDGRASSVAGEVMNCQTILCVLRTPLVFCPSIAVIIISCILTGKTLETVWEWCGIERGPHIVEVDVLSKRPVV